MKKSFVVGVTWLLLATVFFPVNASDISQDVIREKSVNIGKLNNNLTGVLTHGPYVPLLNIATINLITGDPEEIEKIEHILDNRILMLVFLEQRVNVTGLDFSITYKWNIPKSQSLVANWIFLRFRYNTYIVRNGNETSIGDVNHTIIVKGFVGEFRLGRPLVFRFFPPQFVFNGDCEEVTIMI